MMSAPSRYSGKAICAAFYYITTPSVPGAVRENPCRKAGEVSGERNINKFCAPV